jgi:sulfur carrier protein
MLVNGREQAVWEPGLTVSGLIDRMRYTFPHVIVTIDGEVVPRQEYATREVPASAEVRVIHLSAGG